MYVLLLINLFFGWKPTFNDNNLENENCI